MQNWHIFGLFAASLGFSLVCLVFFSFWLTRALKRIDALEFARGDLSARLDGCESIATQTEERLAAFEAEEAASAKQKHEELSARGSKGVQVREENKEMRNAALSEGRAVLSSSSPLPEKWAQIQNLIKKYPLVSEGVARQLNREFKISTSLGISEDNLLAEVAKVVMSQAAPQQNEGLPWYG